MSALTVQDMVLLHLSKYGIYRDKRVVPEEITQAGIADAVGVKRPHISVELKRMRDEKGWIEEKKAHAGPGNKKKVYFNLRAGEERASEIRKMLEKRKVILEMDGEQYAVKASQAVDLLTSVAHMPYPLAANRALSDTKLSIKEIMRMSRKRYSSPLPVVKHLFGREQEEERIERWLSGKKSVLSVVGPAGVGKSTLVAKVLSGQDRSVLWKRIGEEDSCESFIEALADFFQRNGEAKLATHLRSGDHEQMGKYLSLMETEYILVFDDYQNASPGIRGIMRRMKQCITKHRSGTKMIVMSRAVPDFYDKKDLIIERNVEEMFLRGLSRESAEKMLRALKIYPGDEKFRNIYAKSAGYPMILRMAASTPGDGLQEITEYLTKEFYDGLKPEERDVLARVAVFYEPVPPEAFLHTDKEIEVLRRLVKRGLIHRDQTGAYFTHDLIQEAFSSNRDLTKEHLEAAEYYAGDKDRYAERLRHLILGGAIEIAENELKDNAGELLSRGNSKTIAETLKSAPETPVFLSVRAMAIASSGSLDDALEVVKKAVDIAEGENRAYALTRLGIIHRMRGDYNISERIIKEALEQQRDETEKMRSIAALSETLFFMGRYKEAEELCARAIDYFSSAGLEYDRITTMGRMAMAIARQGRYERAISILKDCAAGYEKGGNYRNLGATYNQIAMYEAYIGMRDDARRHFEMAALYGDLTGHPRLTATALMNSADNYLHINEVEKALAYATKARELFRSIGDKGGEHASLTVIAGAYMKMGELEKGRETYTQLEEALKEAENYKLLGDAYLERADLEDDREVRRELIESAIEAYGKIGYEAGIKEARSRLEEQ